MASLSIHQLIAWNHNRAEDAFIRGRVADSKETKDANISTGNYHRATAWALESMVNARNILKMTF